MAADFKSHILSRDEKGFGGVPFKRLLFGGIAGPDAEESLTGITRSDALL